MPLQQPNLSTEGLRSAIAWRAGLERGPADRGCDLERGESARRQIVSQTLLVLRLSLLEICLAPKHALFQDPF